MRIEIVGTRAECEIMTFMIRRSFIASDPTVEFPNKDDLTVLRTVLTVALVTGALPHPGTNDQDGDRR